MTKKPRAKVLRGWWRMSRIYRILEPFRPQELGKTNSKFPIILVSRLNDLLHESEGRLVSDLLCVLACSNKGETATENKFHRNVEWWKSQGRVHRCYQVNTEDTDLERDKRFKVHLQRFLLMPTFNRVDPSNIMLYILIALSGPEEFCKNSSAKSLYCRNFEHL